MLAELQVTPFYPLSFSKNSFSLVLTDGADIERYIPSYLYAMVYRKGQDPRGSEVKVSLFDDCKGSSAMCADFLEPVICCPEAYWTHRADRTGFSYEFHLSKDIFISKEGTYVVEVIAPSDERPRKVNVDDNGEIWFELFDAPTGDCFPLKDRVCLKFEFEVVDCHNFSYSDEGIGDPLNLWLEAERIDFPPCKGRSPSIYCPCDESVYPSTVCGDPCTIKDDYDNWLDSDVDCSEIPDIHCSDCPEDPCNECPELIIPM